MHHHKSTCLYLPPGAHDDDDGQEFHEAKPPDKSRKNCYFRVSIGKRFGDKGGLVEATTTKKHMFEQNDSSCVPCIDQTSQEEKQSTAAEAGQGKAGREKPAGCAH